jgi:hypothetical protein
MGKADSDPLANYFGSLAVFHQGGELWKKWWAAQRKALLSTQHADGDKDGSWDPCGPFGGMGRAGITALNTLCLAVYFRYLPVYK